MNLIYRHATENDIPVLIKMLSDDSLGKLREDASIPVNPCYLAAMQHIQNDPNNELTSSTGSSMRNDLAVNLILPFLSEQDHIGFVLLLPLSGCLSTECA